MGKMDKETLKKMQESTMNEICNSAEKLEKFLSFQSDTGISSYSVANQLLAFSQMPTMTKLMVYGNKQGTSGWLKYGRRVKKGEKAIYLWRPMVGKKKDKDGNVVKNPDGTDQTELFGFAPFAMFDVSQTEGDPLPDANTADEDPAWEEADDLWEVLHPIRPDAIQSDSIPNMVWSAFTGLSQEGATLATYLVLSHFNESTRTIGLHNVIGAFKTADEKKRMKTLNDAKKAAADLISDLEKADEGMAA